MYAKVMLTVSAAALVAIALQGVVPHATAQPKDCGMSQWDPCFVRIVD